MEIQVLGPLRLVASDGEAIRIRSAPQRRLVSLLATRSGRVVSCDHLADALGLSVGALRTSVSRLRRVVGADVLRTVPPGYCLQADRTDVERFERLIAEGRAAGDPSDARSALEESLRCWRGEPYAEFGDEPWALAEAHRLGEARAGALEDLVELLLDDSEWTPAILRLEPLIAEHPLRPRPRELLMRALAASGRRAEALRAYQAYRSHLAEETGTSPAEALVALDRADRGRHGTRGGAAGGLGDLPVRRPRPRRRGRSSDTSAR